MLGIVMSQTVVELLYNRHTSFARNYIISKVTSPRQCKFMAIHWILFSSHINFDAKCQLQDWQQTTL